MIEKVLLDYLSDSLSAPAYMEIPKTPPSRYFVIEKTSGAQVNHINNSTFAIKSYAGSLYEAASMNEELKGVVLSGLITLDEISSVTLNSDYNYTDTQTKTYRYQAVFDIVHY